MMTVKLFKIYISVSNSYNACFLNALLVAAVVPYQSTLYAVPTSKEVSILPFAIHFLLPKYDFTN